MSKNDEVYRIDWGVELPDFTHIQIRHHAYLMIQGGLIEGTVRQGTRDPLPLAAPSSITWAGHDFLEAVKDPSLWDKARINVIKPAGGVAFSVLLEWVKTEAMTRLGLK